MSTLLWRTASICLTSVALCTAIGSASAQTKFVGRAPDGQIAFEYVGTVLQDDTDFESYGYLTYIRGLDYESLYFDAENRNEANARFTFHSVSKTTSQVAVGKTFNVNVDGEMTVYFRSSPVADASMDSGDHFTVGYEIARFTFRGQSIVSVTSPNLGVNWAALEVTQDRDKWRWFDLNNESHALGRPGATLRFSHIGRGDRSQPEPPIARLAIAGQATSLDGAN